MSDDDYGDRGALRREQELAKEHDAQRVEVARQNLCTLPRRIMTAGENYRSFELYAPSEDFLYDIKIVAKVSPSGEKDYTAKALPNGGVKIVIKDPLLKALIELGEPFPSADLFDPFTRRRPGQKWSIKSGPLARGYDATDDKGI